MLQNHCKWNCHFNTHNSHLTPHQRPFIPCALLRVNHKEIITRKSHFCCDLEKKSGFLLEHLDDFFISNIYEKYQKEYISQTLLITNNTDLFIDLRQILTVYSMSHDMPPFLCIEPSVAVTFSLLMHSYPYFHCQFTNTQSQQCYLDPSKITVWVKLIPKHNNIKRDHQSATVSHLSDDIHNRSSTI